MLDRNRLPSPPPSDPMNSGTMPGWDLAWDAPAATAHGPFASAEDYDATGILAGVDPCESRYWWMPELHASAEGPLGVLGHAAVVERPARDTHAARRAGSRSTAAA